MSVDTAVFWLIALVALGGAVATVLARDAMRMIAGLAAFLLSVAGFFVFFGLPLLGAVQVFVYVGGVLVMMIFALMVVRRTDGKPSLETKHDMAAASVSIALFVLLSWTLRGAAPNLGRAEFAEGSITAVADQLLGPMLIHFELLGVLLLVALLAVLAIAGERDES